MAQSFGLTSVDSLNIECHQDKFLEFVFNEKASYYNSESGGRSSWLNSSQKRRKSVEEEEEEAGGKEEQGRVRGSNWLIKFATLDPLCKSAALDPVRGMYSNTLKRQELANIKGADYITRP